ncbi:PKD domain-containing protein [Georgenia faecalis]|uniref:PKD domain-containing protein n=1 Tax=Georgenia faecalis TaxID=2483799 RepID=A0ABV9DAR2_9MICO|nr:PKD domain-containing protein [Georgenia faecalis]
MDSIPPVADRCWLILFTNGRDREWISSCDVPALVGGTELTPSFEWATPADPAAPGEPVPLPPGEPVIVTAQDLQSLPIDSGGLTVQPDRGWVLVNMETIALTGAREHTLETVVLGVPVQVRVAPVEFSWDFGDGSAPLVGTDPGAPWPDHTVAHTYTVAGDAQLTLTTQWEGAFLVEGSPDWIPVTGRAVTQEVSDPFEVVTATPRLVRNN